MVVKFSEVQKDIKITPKSKNETYEYTGTATGVQIDVTAENIGENTGYSEKYHSFATNAANGVDLIITTFLYDTVKNTSKLVTTTIKDFYKDTQTYNAVNIFSNDFKAGWTVIPPNQKNSYIKIHQPAEATDFSSDNDRILASSAANAELALSKGGNDTVLDIKGDNKYVLSPSYKNFDNSNPENPHYVYENRIYEFDGNDSYAANDDSYTTIRDFKGNDSITATGTYNYYEHTLVNVEDYAGNDTYKTSYCGIISGYDYKGNDTYDASGSGRINIYDYAGNDTYNTSSNGYLWVKDYKGNDKYTKESNADGAHTIICEESGNDNYNFKGTNGNYSIYGLIDISEEKGNDKYHFENVCRYDTTTGNDRSSNDIHDYLGNDNFELINSAGFSISDYKGNDKYTLANSTFSGIVYEKSYKFEENCFDQTKIMMIADYDGGDTYNLKNVRYSHVASYYGIEDYGKSGADKYIFDSTENLRIIDTYTNDSYTITNSLGIDMLYEADHTTKRYQKDENGNNYDGDNDGNPDLNIAVSIQEYGGNEKYVINGDKNLVGGVTIFDSNGNDSYTVTKAERIDIADHAGKDNYKITDSNSVKIQGHGDNGKIDILTAQATCSGFDLSNYGEKTTYNLKGNYNKKTDSINWIQETTITDISTKSTDTYNLQYVYTGTIEDYGGSDKYTFNNCKDLSVTDNKDENDKYTISGAETYGVIIKDKGGNDTYNAKGTKNNNLKRLAIFDTGDNGSDTYNFDYVNNSLGGCIEDRNGNNTFNIKNSTSIVIWTEGKDTPTNKFNLTNCTDFTITDYNSSAGYGSNGIYNLKNSKGYIYDRFGNDEYKIDKLTKWVRIEDRKGDNDILKIGGNQKDFVFLPNISAAGDGTNSMAELIIYDTKNKGHVKIYNFYLIDKNNLYTGRTNSIDTVKIGNKEVSNEMLFVAANVYSVSAVREQTASWLKSNNYSTVESCLMQGNQEHIDMLVNQLTQNDYHGYATNM